METTDIVTKQNLILQAATNDPEDAVALCQSDNRFRRACKELSAQSKFQLCLHSGKTAQECDNVPMYSRAQFLALIPPVIEIFEDEPLQLRHEFYSQNYKLSTEGFAQALYKAKVINTICALIRPKVLKERIDEMGPLPAYIDAALLDRAIRTYEEAVEIADRIREVLQFHVEIRSTMNNGDVVSMTLMYSYINSWIGFWVTLSTERDDYQDLKSIIDPFVSKDYEVVMSKDPPSDLNYLHRKQLFYQRLDEAVDAPNVFIISRIIYEMLNRGFMEWTVRYWQYNQSTGEDLLDVKFKV